MDNNFLYFKKINCKDTGEICTGYKEYLNSEHWKNIRSKMVFEDSVCKKCKKKGILQVHHKNYKNLGNENINKDLVLLCEKCHKLTHKVLSKRTKRTTSSKISCKNCAYYKKTKTMNLSKCTYTNQCDPVQTCRNFLRIK